jgi:MFS family permease
LSEAAELAASTSPARAPLWTRAFTLLCITGMLGFAHQAVMTPTVPLYVDEKGGSALLAGLALLSFSVPSVSVRPWLGRFTDTANPGWVLGGGLLLLMTGGLLFLMPYLAFVFIASMVRGLGWAGLNTGGYTLLATASPASRRGEASGYYTGFQASASVAFPAIALALIDGPGFESAFLLSAALALIGVPFALGLGKNHAPPQPVAPTLSGAPVASTGLFETGVLLATSLNLCSTLAGPAVTAFLPLFAKDLDIGGVGFFYIVAGIVSIVIRPLLGQKSDSIGRAPSIALALGSQLIGFSIILVSSTLPMIILGGVFVTLGTAMNSSASTALAMDLASPQSRGKSMATFSISFQLGAGIGAFLAGALVDTVGFRGMYGGAIVITLLGLVLLAFIWRMLPKP